MDEQERSYYENGKKEENKSLARQRAQETKSKPSGASKAVAAAKSGLAWLAANNAKWKESQKAEPATRSRKKKKAKKKTVSRAARSAVSRDPFAGGSFGGADFGDPFAGSNNRFKPPF